MIYGIDLGTTFSAIAHVNPLHVPVCLPVGADGKSTIPSAVLLTEGNRAYVGEEAIELSYLPDTLLVEHAKRSIGLHNGSTWSYKGWRYIPEEISALVLRKIAQLIAQDGSFEPVRDVVVSHPQYFWMNQKEATREAVDLAGLNLVATITEPNAAAIAYGVFNPADDGEKTVLVFDLGGGTFDVTLMRLGGRTRFHMLGSDGDPQLGGMNWDAQIVSLAKERFRQDAGVDFDDVATPEQHIGLRKLAEKAKIRFSSPSIDMHRFSFEGGNNKLFIEITRDQFDVICRPLVERCLDRCTRLLQKTGYGWQQVDEVLLVGSSTKMPTIQGSVARVAGKTPRLDREPKLMVAKGAAMWGRWVSDRVIDPRWGEPEEAGVAGLVVHEKPDVVGRTAHGLGVMARSGGREAVTRIIEQNAETPCEKERTFYTDRDGATAILVPLYEGESEEPSECFMMGDVRLDGLPPRPKEQPVKVKFKIDVSGRLEVTVSDVEAGREQVKRLEKVVLRGGQDGAQADPAARRRHLSEIVVI